VNPWHLLYVALGGAMGAVARALAGHWIRGTFPWSTLTVNVAGSLIIGFVLAWMATKPNQPQALTFLVATGFCGSFTTFSTFSYETLALLQQQRWEAGLANIALNILVCLGAVWGGIKLAMTVNAT